MTRKHTSFFTSLFILAVTAPFMAPAATAQSIAIVTPESPGLIGELAAKEARRYLYVRTGRLVQIGYARAVRPRGRNLIVIGRKDQPLIQAMIRDDAVLARAVNTLKAQQYLLKTLPKRNILLIAGGDAVGTLYGAYRFAEHLGVRFYLHGDVIPDERMPLQLPVLDDRGAPLFETRGIQPFHDFPEGPDWWNTDDYKAILAQLPKLRMNFFGLHTYPEGGVGPEPTVWIGAAEDVNPDGTVQFSSQSSYQNTLRGNWGYAARKTSDFSFGAAQLFERDAFGPDVMGDMIPGPTTAAERNAVFNGTGKMLREAFEFARVLGVKTCVGTETPLIIPKMVKERLQSRGKDPADPEVVRAVYEGMFRRIAKAYPVDYYWFWTPENWTWSGVKDEEVAGTVADLTAAIAAAKNVGAPFTLATCGWVLGPPKDRTLFDNILPKEMPMSCINRNVGFAPVETGFARVQGRPQWAIPWMEDDPALIIPQLWAGRMRRDAADALAYGCSGLLGIHWRTRVLSPNISALAHAAWEQKPWNPRLSGETVVPDLKRTEGRQGGSAANFPGNAIADTEKDALYQTVTYNVKAYRLKVPDGVYTVRLQFCEPHYEAAGKRIFGVSLQGQTAIQGLDVFAEVGKNKALDYTFQGVQVSDGLLEIGFDSIVEYPFIAAFSVAGQGVTRRVNCGGAAFEDYEGDMAASADDDGPRDLPADDFYADWAQSQFGATVAEPVARLFVRLDGGANVGTGGQGGTNLPRPSTWVNGPGGINPDNRPWSAVEPEYAFVEELAALRTKVKGAGNLERFDYWLKTFRYLKAVGQVNCTWARFNAIMEGLRQEKDAERQKQMARQEALPIREALTGQVAEVHRLLLATITTPGGMGTVANWQQHLLPGLLAQPGEELAGILGDSLSVDAMPSMSYQGPARLIVPTVRGNLMVGEDLKLKVIILSAKPVHGGKLFWRPLGQDRFAAIPLTHVARGVYTVTVPAAPLEGRDFEYYIEAASPGDGALRFPATAPHMNQTVVVASAD